MMDFIFKLFLQYKITSIGKSNSELDFKVCITNGANASSK